MLLLSMALLVPLLFVAYHGMSRIERRIASDTEVLLDTTLQQFERQLRTELVKMQHVANVIADDGVIRGILTEWHPDDEPVGGRYALALARTQRRVADIKANLLVPFPHDVSIRTPQGQVFNSFEAIGWPYRFLALRMDHLSAMVQTPERSGFGRVDIERFGTDVYLTYSRPMPFPGTGFAGVVLVSVPSQYLSSVVDPGDDGQLVLLDAGGRVITRFGSGVSNDLADPVSVELPLGGFPATLRYTVSGGQAFAEIARLRHEWVLVIVVCFVAAVLLVALAVVKVTGPIVALTGRLQTQLGHSRFANPDDSFPVDEYETLRLGINALFDRVDSLIDELVKTERERQQAHYEALRAQITPHFLFNTLNALRWKAVGFGAQEISDAVASLGFLLEQSTTRGSELIRLVDELRIVRSYVHIHQFRFDTPVKLDVQVPTELEDVLVPRFVLQPIVENSVLHGVRHDTAITVVVTAGMDGDTFVLTVRDNGTGMDAASVEQPNRATGIGLPNVDERLKHCFGSESGLSQISVPGEGTSVVLTMKGVERVSRASAG